MSNAVEEATSQQVELFIRPSRNLFNKDLILDITLSSHEGQQTLRKEQLTDTGSPGVNNFVNISSSIRFEHKFDVRQEINITLRQRKSNRQYARVRQLTVGSLISLRTETIIERCLDTRGVQCGQIQLNLQYLLQEHERVILGFRCQNFLNGCLSCLFTYKIYFRIFKRCHQNGVIEVYRSESGLAKQFTFRQIDCSFRKLANQDLFQNIYVQFSNADDHQVIGTVCIRLSELQQGIRGYKAKKLPLHAKEATNQSLYNRYNGAAFAKQNLGELYVTKYQNDIRYTMDHFLEAGMQLALQVCIDFSKSNRSYTNKDSLHYFDIDTKSYYERALHETTSILLDRDYDKLVPVYGFGTRVRGLGSLDFGKKTSHYFPLTGNPDQHFVYELEGVRKVYRQAMSHLEFSGPTRLAPLLSESIKKAKAFQEESREYMILLILTDGEIYDSQDTIDLIIQCCQLPISIIFIGISNRVNDNCWGFMERLNDNNEQLVDSHGRKTTRDLVAFVQFQRYANRPQQFASRVLEQLPDHIVKYHKLIGATPQIYRREVDEMRQQQRAESRIHGGTHYNGNIAVRERNVNEHNNKILREWQSGIKPRLFQEKPERNVSSSSHLEEEQFELPEESNMHIRSKQVQRR